MHDSILSRSDLVLYACYGTMTPQPPKKKKKTCYSVTMAYPSWAYVVATGVLAAAVCLCLCLQGNCAHVVRK